MITARILLLALTLALGVKAVSLAYDMANRIQTLQVTR
jgi:hypothetical protein